MALKVETSQRSQTAPECASYQAYTGVWNQPDWGEYHPGGLLELRFLPGYHYS